MFFLPGQFFLSIISSIPIFCKADISKFTSTDPFPTFYQLSVGNNLYNDIFIKMVVALVKHNVPFEAAVSESLDDLTGEKFVGVNTKGFDTFYYHNSRQYREKYFPHIQWEEIKVLKWK